jgi:hypothetical protein
MMKTTARFLAYGGLFAALALGFVVTTHGPAPAPSTSGSLYPHYPQVDAVAGGNGQPASREAVAAQILER